MSQKKQNLKIFTDGGARGNPGPAGIGVYVIAESSQEESKENDSEIQNDAEVIFSLAKYVGSATNNEAEYKALLASLEWLREHVEDEVSVRNVDWFLDSKLVVEQVLKNWKVKDARMRGFANKAWKILAELEALGITWSIRHVRREKNKEADALVNQAVDEHLAL